MRRSRPVPDAVPFRGTNASVFPAHASIRIDVVLARRARIARTIRVGDGTVGRSTCPPYTYGDLSGRAVLRWSWDAAVMSVHLPQKLLSWWARRCGDGRWRRRLSPDSQASPVGLVTFAARDDREAIDADAHFQPDPEPSAMHVDPSTADCHLRATRDRSDYQHVVAGHTSRRAPDGKVHHRVGGWDPASDGPFHGDGPRSYRFLSVGATATAGGKADGDRCRRCGHQGRDATPAAA